MHAAIVDGARTELTNMVSRAQKDLTYSPHVRRCIAYIDQNPDRKLTDGCRGRPLRPVAGLSLPSVQMRIGRKPEHLYDRPKTGVSQNPAVEGCTAEQVCYSLGFSSQSHFIALFKRRFGMTPREYTALLGTEK